MIIISILRSHCWNWSSWPSVNACGLYPRCGELEGNKVHVQGGRMRGLCCHRQDKGLGDRQGRCEGREFGN